MSQDEERLAQLLAADLDGNIELLVETFEKRIVARAMQWTRNNDHDAQDVAQDTFLRAYRALRGYSATSICELPLWSWLHTIALHAFLNMKRDRAKHASVQYFDYQALPEVEIDSQEWPENVVESEEQRQEMLTLITALPRYREVLWLHYFDDRGLEEIATLLNKPIGTIKSDLYRGRKLLREAMMKSLDEVQ